MQAGCTIGHTSTLVVLILQLIMHESVDHTYLVDIQNMGIIPIGHTSTLVVLILHLIMHESVDHTYIVDIQNMKVSTFSYYDPHNKLN